MNVTICSYDEPGYASGFLTWVRSLMPALRDQGVTCRALFFTLDAPERCATLQVLLRQGFDCTALPVGRDVRVQVRAALDHVANHPTDVFIANNVVAAFYAGRWIRAAGIPTVGVLHSDDPLYLRGYCDQFARGDPRCRVSAFACVSEEIRRLVRPDEATGVGFATLPYGVEPGPAGRPAAASPFRVAYLGRLAEEQKRISEVARALCLACREIRGVEAVIYGDGPDRDKAERVLATEGVGLPVRLGGLLDNSDVYRHLGACHALALLSDYEGLPIAVLEAMACGVVPVCLEIRSGIPELVEHGTTGLIVHDRREGFVAAIRRLNEDRSLWQALSQNARDRIGQRFTNAASADRWRQFFEAIRRAAGPRRRLRIPWRFRLPDVHPLLAFLDDRPRTLSTRILGRLRRTARMLAGVAAGR